MNNSNKSEGNENITVNENNKHLNNEKKSLDNLCTTNILLFCISIMLFNWGINAFQYLDNPAIGIGMIIGIPIFVFLFGAFAMVCGIISFVFEIISMKKILTGEVDKIYKIIAILEICGYIVFYLFKVS